MSDPAFAEAMKVATGEFFRRCSERARQWEDERRRWAAIEACETTPSARMKGAMQAAGAALAKVRATTNRVQA